MWNPLFGYIFVKYISINACFRERRGIEKEGQGMIFLYFKSFDLFTIQKIINVYIQEFEIRKFKKRNYDQTYKFCRMKKSWRKCWNSQTHVGPSPRPRKEPSLPSLLKLKSSVLSKKVKAESESIKIFFINGF